MRQKLQDLQSPAVSTPLTAPVSTFAPGNIGVKSLAPVEQERVDLSTLSNAARQIQQENQDFLREGKEKLGFRADQMRQRGVSEEDIIKELSDTEKNPRRVASAFAKLAESGGIDKIDDPYFLMGLEKSRGRFVANQAIGAAQALEQETAVKLGLLAPGDEAGRAKVISEMLSGIDESIEESRKSLGPIGRQALAERLAVIAEQTIQNVDGKAKTVREDEYAAKRSGDRSKYFDLFIQNENNPGIQDFSVDRVGEDYSEDKLIRGAKEARDSLVDDLVAAGTRIGVNHDWGKSADFLRRMESDVKEASGNRIFVTQHSEKLTKAIEYAEYKQRQEDLDRPAKAAALQREAAAMFQAGEAGDAYAQAENQSPDAIRLVHANVEKNIQLAENGDQEALKALGVEEDKLPFLRHVNNSALISSLERGNAINSPDDDRVEEEYIYQGLLDGGVEEAQARLLQSDLAAKKKYEINRKIREVDSNAILRSQNIANSQGISEQIDLAVLRAKPNDTEIDPVALKSDQAEANFEFKNLILQAQEEKGAALSFSEISQMGKEYIQSIENKGTERVREAVGAGDADEGKDIKDLSYSRSLKEEQDKAATKIINGESASIIGNLPRDLSDRDIGARTKHFVTLLDEQTLNPAMTVAQRGAGPAWKFVRDLKHVISSEAFEPSEKESFVVEALTRTGHISISALVAEAETPEEYTEQIKANIVENLEPKQAPDLPIYDDPDNENLVKGRRVFKIDAWTQSGTASILDVVEDFNVEGLNINLIRVPEFAEDLEYLLPREESSDLAWNPKVERDPELIQDIRDLLERVGLNSGDDEVMSFIAKQNTLYGR